MSDQIVLPENPRQGDVVEWWTMRHHPVEPYVQHPRATYYEDAACGDVLGKGHAGGRRFDREWLCETWYVPSGSQSSGGRNTTEGLRQYFAAGPTASSVHLTWEGARNAAATNMRERAAEFRSMAERLERNAAKLEASALPKGFR